VDDGFHCTPLVPGCLKALQYVLPCAVGAARCYLSNEVNSFACAAQYDGRGRADTQLRIDWKVRHGPLTPSCGPSSIHHMNLQPNRCLTRACCRSLPRSKPRLEVKGAARSHSRAIPPETIKLAVILNHMPLDTNQWVMG
jgi:hypothetical protein